MLKYLNIFNLAVVHRIRIDFHEGLNLLTGETGAGKSIIVDALSLLLGGRGGAEIVRAGERSATIEGLFELTGESEQKVGAVLSQAGIETENGDDLLIRREVQVAGRSRIFINDQVVTAATLRTLQPYLVEIFGQGEQQALSAARTHLELLDSFAGCAELRREVAAAYARWRETWEALRSLEKDEAEREHVEDLIRYQIAEIERINPRPDEDNELAAEKVLLMHAERALELSAGAYAELYESDQSILSGLASVRRRLQELTAIDSSVMASAEALDAATRTLEDVAEILRGYAVGVDFSHTRLDEIEGRLAELERLRRKYRRDLRGLIDLRNELQERLRQLHNTAERRSELERELTLAGCDYMAAARHLSACRRDAASEMEKRVIEDLRHVAMEQARFMVHIETSGLDAGESSQRSGAPDREVACANAFWTPRGVDRVEFLLSANVGEAAQPLGRAASGGELSRLMLVLRTVCQGTKKGREGNSGVTLIFDEVDAGIGGQVAEAVGRRLKALAQRQQVLCVTHQPQIARFANHHYAVSKHVEEGRTSTYVHELSGEERVGELARMISGAKDVRTARETARWMLESAEEPGVKSSGARGQRTRGRKSSPPEQR